MTTEPVTIEQAAALLGVSASTIRRRIRAGTLQVTETRRPQGVVWLVHLPPGTAPAAAGATVDTAPVDTAATGHPAPAEAMVSLIQATLTPIVGPLVAELAASRQANERQAEVIRDQAETIGRLTATLEAHRAPEMGDAPREPAGSRWRLWMPWLLAMALLVAVVALLAWPW